MIHQRLDIAAWKSLFFVPRLRKGASGKTPGVGGISGPCEIAVLEQLREMSYADQPGIERVPTDIFIWSRGEASQRTVTKIGGLPFREANIPWPLTPSGNPLTFVAQICFADSRDITPALPGDILLIFTEAKTYKFAGKTYYDFMGEAEDDSLLLFEWVMLRDLPLVTAQDIPPTGLHILPCYGTLHRGWDYAQVDGFAYPDIEEYIPPVIEATKIGGICPWLDEESEGPGTYLCSLRSLDNEIYLPFPFLNVPEPMSWDEWSHCDPLMIGDVGLINLFLKDDGTLRWTFHTH